MTHRERIKCCLLRAQGYSVRAICVVLALPLSVVRDFLDSCPSPELHVRRGE